MIERELIQKQYLPRGTLSYKKRENRGKPVRATNRDIRIDGVTQRRSDCGVGKRVAWREFSKQKRVGCSGVVSAATEGESQSPLGQPAVRSAFGFRLLDKGARARSPSASTRQGQGASSIWKKILRPLSWDVPEGVWDAFSERVPQPVSACAPDHDRSSGRYDPETRWTEPPCHGTDNDVEQRTYRQDVTRNRRSARA
nr:PREDICTED: uncharacterized protein LOC105664393 [Megachile rotundata]